MLDARWVRESLDRLARAKANIFGANGHHFLLNAALKEAEVASFEQRHGIRLPDDYRQFLTTIGNGGAGPDYGVFPLGKMDGWGRDEFKPWTENDGFVGTLSEPFPFVQDWNDLSGEPADELRGDNESEYDRQMEQFEARYWNSSLVNGAIPLCHRGCAIRIWLVVTGTQAGRLWRDGRAEFTGLSPLLLRDNVPATFSLWYSEWLENALREAGLASRN